MEGGSVGCIDEHGRGDSSATSIAATNPPSTVTDYFCEECFAPAQMTPRGPRCERHDHPEIMCEPCGERPAAAIHNGLWACGRCISEGWF